MLAAGVAQWLTGGLGLVHAGGPACSRSAFAQSCVLFHLRVGTVQKPGLSWEWASE